MAEQTLSGQELDRAMRLIHSEDRRIFIATHIALRLLLADILAIDPTALTFKNGPWGKPQLSGPAESAVRFSISHTRGRAMVGLSSRPIGVDVEFKAQLQELEQIAKMIFVPEVASSIINIPTHAQIPLFYRHWCLSEAFIKTTGRGLSQGMDSFSFNCSGAPALITVTRGYEPTSRWAFGLIDGSGDGAATPHARTCS